MHILRLMLSGSLVALATPALADTTTPPAPAAAAAKTATPQADRSAPAPKKESFSTGVAKARDLLDSAISTSSLDEDDVLKLSPLSVSDLLRDLPGVRSDASQGEGYGNISIRGLPIASTGSKFVQLQEDGLPVLEFGDLAFASADTFIRFDSTVGEVQAIRGGSASTFASNSPGGVINFISKTGVNAGGSVQTTLGLDYRSYRLDFDYGTPLSDTLRVNVGGFYRRGQGPRDIGYDGQDGGQIKINVTKQFTGGYIRLYGKYLNDRTPVYGYVPMRVTGTDSNPSYASIPGFDMKRDALLSRNFNTIVGLDGNNSPSAKSMRDGQHPIVKSVGMEAQFTVAGFSITDRFRYAGISGSFTNPEFIQYAPAAAVMGRVGGYGGTLTYASGPNAGKVIANPATLNGNGLLAAATYANNNYDSLDNVTNDIRGTRSWKLGNGEFTATAGFYKSRQTIDTSWLWSSVIQDVVGGGNAALIDVTSASGLQITQNGAYGYGAALLGGCCRQQFRTKYDVNAPYGSVNYHIGKLAVGGSVRYDMGTAQGTLAEASGFSSYDINGDGRISDAETRTSRLNLATPGLIDYSYKTLSYSLSANYRLAETWSVFGRYSRGGRANADRIVSTRFINYQDGSLLIPSAKVDHVTQAEGGFKYRTASTMLNVTAFWAESQDTNVDPRDGTPIDRLFRAKGVELEAGYTRGIFSLTAGATYTDAKIARDGVMPELVGKTPHNQAKLIYELTPQINTGRFTLGAVFLGTTGSYATDENALRIPAYTTTNAFVQFRPVERLLLSVNANNLFNATAITGVLDSTIPAGGIVQGRTLAGRTVSASARLTF
jgi:outer membrane receptor protein involved in Fe transport